MERQLASREATTGGRTQRASRTEDKSRSGDASGGFQLHTAVLAQQREQRQQQQSSETRACLQMRKAQQKLLGKKTIEDFARLKLLRRETSTTRSPSLHCNGKPATASPPQRATAVKPAHQHFQEELDSRPLRSAREPRSTPTPIMRKRPLSAKPALPTQPCHASVATTNGSAEAVVAGKGLVTGQRISVRQWEQNFCNPVVLAAARADAATQALASSQSLSRLTSMIGKKKASKRTKGRLGVSTSTSALPDKPGRSHKLVPASKKLNIVVDMRRLELQDGRDDDTVSSKALPLLDGASPSSESERLPARVQAWM